MGESPRDTETHTFQVKLEKMSTFEELAAAYFGFDQGFVVFKDTGHKAIASYRADLVESITRTRKPV